MATHSLLPTLTAILVSPAPNLNRDLDSRFQMNIHVAIQLLLNICLITMATCIHVYKLLKSGHAALFGVYGFDQDSCKHTMQIFVHDFESKAWTPSSKRAPRELELRSRCGFSRPLPLLACSSDRPSDRPTPQLIGGVRFSSTQCKVCKVKI